MRMVEVGYLSDDYSEARRYAQQGLALGESGSFADKIKRLVAYMDKDEQGQE
jgi:hypothetical protein